MNCKNSKHTNKREVVVVESVKKMLKTWGEAAGKVTRDLGMKEVWKHKMSKLL